MNSAELPAIAVIADAHLHDTNSNYDFTGVVLEQQPLTLRSWHDTRKSSRVFNETKAALNLALQDIYNRGIRHVVLLGDMSDDGQIEATHRLLKILNHHREQYDMEFFVMTGNHDAYALMGKHQSTRFMLNDTQDILVTSDPDVAQTEPDCSVLTPKMYCDGVAQTIERFSDFGLFNQPRFLHWESPFGPDDAIHERCYQACSADGRHQRQLVDASYLVEPVDGLWLLMIDASVFTPNNGRWRSTQKKAFIDSSDAGWNSVLSNKPYLIDWISNVCSRAGETGKKLIAFSHYPIMDVFKDTQNIAYSLFGNNEMQRRKPDKKVAKALLSAGLQLHFSGHLHVNGLSQLKQENRLLEDCAVPSLASFPACYKIVQTDNVDFTINTIHIGLLPLSTALMEHYRRENANKCQVDEITLSSRTYGNFLYARMRLRVIHHFLKKEWPESIAQFVLDNSVFDLLVLMQSTDSADNKDLLRPYSSSAETSATVLAQLSASAHDIKPADLAACPMNQLVADWYCLRQAGTLAREFIDSHAMRHYSYLANTYGGARESVQNSRDFFAVFLKLLKLSIDNSDPPATREHLKNISENIRDKISD